MFGGAGIYCDGLMFALVIKGEIYLKTDTESAGRFRDSGCQPFVYENGGRRVQTSYWSIPEAALDDPDTLRIWAELAHAAALRARKPRTGKAPRRTSA